MATIYLEARLALGFLVSKANLLLLLVAHRFQSLPIGNSPNQTRRNREGRGL